MSRSPTPKTPACDQCAVLHRTVPKGTHTYTVNGVAHTHPDCPRIPR